MELNNTFVVGLPVERTWEVLLDLARVIPCLPGAAVISLDGDEFEGAVKIKVGPVSTQYKGSGRFVEKDRSNYRAVISASGKDAGGGGAKALITATLTEQGSGTNVHVVTELSLSGRAASFGRGVIADVSNRILGQFATNLKAEISADEHGGSDVAPRQLKSIDDVEPVDVGDMAGSLLKYALPSAGILAFLGALAYLAFWRSKAIRVPPSRVIRPQLDSVPSTLPVIVNLIVLTEAMTDSISARGWVPRSFSDESK